MKYEKPWLPIFLENSPSVISDQVLWLIKNSGLNFQVKETPFSLDVNIKNRFTNLWNSNRSNPVYNQPASSIYSPQAPNHHDVNMEERDLQNQVNSLKAKLAQAVDEQNDACKELLDLDKAHRKLSTENKNLLNRHEKVCSDLKAVKVDKENALKEINSLSVALKTSKKNIDKHLENFEKERNWYNAELKNLNQYKIEKDSELKRVKKAEKKSRQRQKAAKTIAVEKHFYNDENLNEIINNLDEELVIEEETAKKGDALDQHLRAEDQVEVEVFNTKFKDSIDTKTVKNTEVTETYTDNSDDPKFLEFPDHFEDWTEEQKKDAYDNHFKLYLQKWLKSPGMRLTYSTT